MQETNFYQEEDQSQKRPTFLRSFKDRLKHLFLPERDSSGLKILEHLSDDRKLLENGEIIDANGNLWGFRLYKATGSWSKYPENSEEFLAEKTKFISDLHDALEKNNTDNAFDSFAMTQRNNWSAQSFTTSWTRNPASSNFKTYIKYHSSDIRPGNIVVADIPLAKCISVENILDNSPEYKNLYTDIVKDKAAGEQEIIVIGPVPSEQVRDIIKANNFTPPAGYSSKSKIHHTALPENQLAVQDRLVQLIS